MTTALLTDHYELTMLQAALADGTAHRHSVFELFARRLPTGRRYGVVAGTGRLLDALEDFRFDPDTVAWLRERGVVDDTTCDWLADYRFTGDVWGYPEGELYFPASPVLVVEGTFAEAVVLETLFLSVLNHDSAIASAAARMVGAADELAEAIDMLARAERPILYTGGGVINAGPRASALFTAQVASLGTGTTLLVDTYDIEEAVRTGIDVAGPGLGAVRIDSGDLPSLARRVREQLDGLGATATRIVVTSDLDEHAIAGLAAAPVDGYGVGTSLVTGSGAPTSGFVYKLVARADDGDALVPVAKKSADKASVGGRKWALRRRSATGTAQAEVVGIGAPPHDDGDDRSLLVPFVEGGTRVHHDTLDDARARHAAAIAELPAAAHKLSAGEPVLETIFER